MFSIVTANWNGEKLLSLFLESLVNQTYKDFILYLIDNGSTDNSINIINSYKNKINIEVIKLENNYGFAKANNIGINKAMKDKNEYIVTLNNDIQLHTNCLSELKNNIVKLSNEYNAFQILLVNFYDRNVIDAAGVSFNKYYIAKQIGHKKSYQSIDEFDNNIDGVCAGAGVYSKECLIATKINEDEYFDSKFFAYYEDVDLSLRLKNIGYKSCLVKEAIAYHIHSGTSGKNSYFKSYYLSRNLQYYLRKNLSDETYHKNRKIYFLYFLKNMIKLTLKAKFSALKGTIKGYLDYRELIKTNYL